MSEVSAILAALRMTDETIRNKLGKHHGVISPVCLPGGAGNILRGGNNRDLVRICWVEGGNVGKRQTKNGF
jgi:hypothetical protein